MHQQLWGYKVEWKSVSRGTGGKKIDYHCFRVCGNQSPVFRLKAYCRRMETACGVMSLMQIFCYFLNSIFSFNFIMNCQLSLISVYSTGQPENSNILMSFSV
jgi:hypothetical protein